MWAWWAENIVSMGETKYVLGILVGKFLGKILHERPRER